MARLFVLVEGQTEETFVNEVLALFLYGQGFESVSAKLMGNNRQRSQRGGVRPWPEVRREIARFLKSDLQLIVTLMVDYYGMPDRGPKAWPGRAAAAKLPRFKDRAPCVHDAIAKELLKSMGPSWNPARFVPFVLMHEFESLLFSDCQKFAAGIARADLAPAFQAIRKKFKSPEEINDAPDTHPSQRIVDLMPEYQKPLYGSLAALEVGFPAMQSECPNFAQWLERLQATL